MKPLYIIVIVLALATLSSLLAFRQEAKAALMKIIYPVLIDRGLVGYWTMNGTDIDWFTGVVSDKSGSGNNGNQFRMSTTTSPVMGVVGQGLDFIGNNYISVPDSDSLDFAGATNSFTFMAWFKPTGTCSGNCRIMDKLFSQQYLIFRAAGANSAAFVMIGAQSLSVGATPENAWSFVAGVYTPGAVTGELKGYLNGVFINSRSMTASSIVPNAQPFRIGSTDAGGEIFNGSIDEVRIYNRALSAAEILYLYQKSAPATSNKISSDQNDLLTSGLTGYWSFDGPTIDWGSSPTVRNVISGVTSSLSGFSKISSPVLGMVGQGLLFQGTSQNSISVSNASNQIIPDSNAAFSIALWFKPKSNFSSSNVGRGLIGNETFGVSGFRWALINNGGGKLQFWSSQNGGSILMTSTNAIATSTWNHVTVSYTGSSAAMYLNGSLNVEDTSGTIVSNTNNILISDSLSASNFFDGIMDEVRVYNRALSAAEVKYLYDKSAPATATKISSDQNSEQTSGLVGLWSFNGPDINWATGVVSDRSGSGNNGVPVNMSTTTSPVMGIVGQGLSFDGVDDYVTMGDVLDFERTDSFTLFAWIKSADVPGAAGAISIIIGKQNNSSPFSGYDLSISSATDVLEFELMNTLTTSDLRIRGTTDVIDGKWHQVAVVYGGTSAASGATFYIDGRVDTTATIVANTLDATTITAFPLQIGTNNSGASRFPGAMDEVRVYNRALSSGEIQELYRSGAR